MRTVIISWFSLHKIHIYPEVTPISFNGADSYKSAYLIVLLHHFLNNSFLHFLSKYQLLPFRVTAGAQPLPRLLTLSIYPCWSIHCLLLRTSSEHTLCQHSFQLRTRCFESEVVLFVCFRHIVCQTYSLHHFIFFQLDNLSISEFLLLVTGMKHEHTLFSQKQKTIH